MFESISLWFSWSNFFYALSLLIGYLLALRFGVGKIVKEVKELFSAIEDANADGKMTNAEMKKIIKEGLDIGKIFLAKYLGIK